MSAALYVPVFYTLVTLLTVCICSAFQGEVCRGRSLDDVAEENENKKGEGEEEYTFEVDDESQTPLWFILPIIIALFIGLRPISGRFVDMVNYAAYWKHSASTEFDWTAENFLFDNIYGLMSGCGLDISLFFLLIAFIYFVCTAFACHKMFGRNALLAFVVFLGAFSTFSYGTNGIKAGAAGAIFLLALAYRENKLLAAFFLWVSLGFHHSMILPIGAFVLCYFVRNVKAYFIFWGVCLLLSFLHISSVMDWLAGLIANTDEGGAAYLSESDDWGGKSGFRFDFLLYSAMPVVIGYYAIYRKWLVSRSYEFLLSVYLVCNGFWLLCMYGSFTNRIAYLSWFMYPIVLVYPFLCESFVDNQSVITKRVVGLHLAFTLFMMFVYY